MRARAKAEEKTVMPVGRDDDPFFPFPKKLDCIHWLNGHRLFHKAVLIIW
jgi:hypothetical protein